MLEQVQSLHAEAPRKANNKALQIQDVRGESAGGIHIKVIEVTCERAKAEKIVRLRIGEVRVEGKHPEKKQAEQTKQHYRFEGGK